MFDDIKIINIRNPKNHVIQRLQEILSKFNLNVKRLEIWSSIIREEDLLKLLNIPTKIEEILFYDVEFCNEDDEELLEDLKLHNLKRWKFHLCNVITPKILLKIPGDVLKSIIIENCIIDQETLRKIFNQQNCLEELEFDPYFVDPVTMKNLKLNNLKLMCNRRVTEIIRNQLQLQSLDLSKAHVGDSEFLEICKLFQLKSLKLWIDRISWEVLENLGNLTNLNEISLSYDRLEIEYIRNISRIKLKNVRKLKLKYPRLKITAENFAEISTNMVNIQYLHISNQSIGVVGALLQNFKNLDTLIIGLDTDSSEVVDFPVEGIRHEKLQELCVYDSHPDQKTLKCSQTILEIVNNCLVNLKRLKLHNVIAFDEQQLAEILTFHPYLTHICFVYPDETVEFGEVAVRALLNHNLKFFKSLGAEIKIHKKVLEKKLKQKFSFVEIKAWKKQIVLRDCRWKFAEE